MRIRDYKTFKKAMEIANNDLYRFQNIYAYQEVLTRLHMLQCFEPETYEQWRKRYIAERRQ